MPKIKELGISFIPDAPMTDVYRYQLQGVTPCNDKTRHPFPYGTVCIPNGSCAPPPGEPPGCAPDGTREAPPCTEGTKEPKPERYFSSDAIAQLKQQLEIRIGN